MGFALWHVLTQRVLGKSGGKPKVASLGVRCTLRKQRVWFDSRRVRVRSLKDAGNERSGDA